MSALLGFPEVAGLRRHQEAVGQSEGKRSSDQAAAFAEYGNDPAKFATYEAAISAADIAHLQRVASSGDANGIDVSGAREMLRQLNATA